MSNFAVFSQNENNYFFSNSRSYFFTLHFFNYLTWFVQKILIVLAFKRIKFIAKMQFILHWPIFDANCTDLTFDVSNLENCLRTIPESA